MRKIIFIFLIVLVSCNSSTENLEAENSLLKHKNDSLQKIIDTLNTKYIFDDVFPAIKRMKPNTFENGQEYFNGEIVMMAYNKYDYALMTQKWDKNHDMISPDTLKSDYGSFQFKIKVTGKDTVIYSLESKNKLGGKNYGKLISIPINEKNFP